MHDWTKDWYTTRYGMRRWWKWLVIAIFGLLLTPFVAWSAATLENPAPGAIKSGVGLVSGWVCDAEELEVSFDGGPRTFVPYGSERTDTAGVCGDTDNGFGLLWNYNELGDGPHTITLYADGIVQTQVNFNVQTLGTNFLRGVNGQGAITLSNGLDVTVQWEETTQGFAIIGYGEEMSGTSTGTPVSPTENLSEFHFLIDQFEWSVEYLVEGSTGPTFVDFNFFDTTRESGIWVVRGEIYNLANSYRNGFSLGRTSELLPLSPSLHNYQYTVLLRDLDDANNAAICQAILFNAEDMVRDTLGNLDIDADFTLAVIEERNIEGRNCSLSTDQYWIPVLDMGIHMEPY